MIAATCKYTEQSNWMIAGLISVMRAFYSFWEGIPEGFTRGQENISLESGDGIHWTPLSCQSSKGMKEIWDNEGRSWSATENDSEYWSEESVPRWILEYLFWDFNRVSISTLWQQSVLSIHSIKQSLLTDLYYQVQGTGTHRDETRHITVLLVFAVNWWLTV